MEIKLMRLFLCGIVLVSSLSVSAGEIKAGAGLGVSESDDLSCSPGLEPVCISRPCQQYFCGNQGSVKQCFCAEPPKQLGFDLLTGSTGCALVTYSNYNGTRSCEICDGVITNCRQID